MSTHTPTPVALGWRDWATSGGVHGLLVAAAAWGMAQGWTPPPTPLRLDMPMRWVEPPTPPTPPALRTPPPPPSAQRPPVQQAQPMPRPRPQALTAPTAQPTPPAPAPRAEAVPATPHTSTSVATENYEQKMASALSNKAQAATNSEATEAPRAAAPAPATPKVDWRGLLNTGLLKHKAYPLSARRMRQEGTVVVQAAFAADGTLLECAVADSSGFATLDAAALQLVRTAAHAALASATPGDRVTLRIPIVYELKDT